jgi:hypothetical protein
MRNRRRWMLPSTLTAALGLLACGEATDAQVVYDFSVDNFDNPTVIDNQWWPHPPGTRYTYEGITVDEGEEIEHQIIMTVTDLTKMIGGVNSVVVYERDISDGELVEAELAFRAQDNAGNVWHMGEYTEEYDAGDLIGGKAWLQGHLHGARAGVMMQGDPQTGTPAYSQGFAPAPVSWSDMGRVREMGQTTEIEYGGFDNVLVTEEFNQEEPGALQIKYYASGTGLVRVGWDGADAQQEELELVSVEQLTPAQMAAERAAALELETRAYTYGQTPPAKQRTDMGGS